MPASLVNAPPLPAPGTAHQRHYGRRIVGAGSRDRRVPVVFPLESLVPAGGHHRFLLPGGIRLPEGTGFRRQRCGHRRAAGLVLPVGTPLWAAALAGFFSIAVVKELFGGIGRNPLNPAMAGRALLMAVWPQTVANYSLPDAVTSATPCPGSGRWAGGPAVRPDGKQHGETSALLILLGGAYLYLKGMIRLRAPLTCLGLFAAVIWIFGG